MPRLLFVLLTIVLALVLARPQSARAQPARDLLQVWGEALAADPLLAAAEAQRGVRHERAEQARAALLPQWTVSAGEVRGSGGATDDRVLIGSVSQVLFDLSRLRSLDAARAELSADEARLRAAAQDLAARVARGYFGVLLAQSGLATAGANESALAAHVAQTESRFAAGLSAQVDVQQSRAAHALARAGTVAARQALADAREGLAQITGQVPGPLRPLARAIDAVPPAPADAEAWVQRALAAHPLLQAQGFDLAAGEQRLAAARAAHGPTLVAGVDSERRRGDPAGTTTTWALRLQLPLFAGGATQSRVREAMHGRDGLRAELELRRRTVVREARTQHESALAGLAAMQHTAAAVAAADQALAATRAGQALGTRGNSDLLLALQTQAAARNAHEQARHGYVLATLLLALASGQPGETGLAAVNHLFRTGD